MGVNLSDLPKHVRDRIADAGMTSVSGQGKPSRSEAGERMPGRCIPSDGSVCDWTGPYGTGWERHCKATGHGRLELVEVTRG